MPRFVLLYHECPPNYERPSHWDLMLEAGDKLRTWALEQLPHDWHSAQTLTEDTYADCPPIAAHNMVPAELLGDHRPDYLHYEGPLSGNRGAVGRIDAGRYVNVTESAQTWDLTLSGALVCGHIRLQSTMPRWTLTYTPGS